MTKQTYHGIFIVVAIIVAGFAVFTNKNIDGFWSSLFAFILGSIGGIFGFLVGDFLRAFVCPDAIFTTGGFFGLLKAKLFWLIGPQLIGIFFGCVAGVSVFAS